MGFPTFGLLLYRVSGVYRVSIVVPFLGLPYRILNIDHKKELTMEPMATERAPDAGLGFYCK